LLNKLSKFLKKNNLDTKSEDDLNKYYHSLEFSTPPTVIYKIDDNEDSISLINKSIKSDKNKLIKKRKRKIPILKILTILGIIFTISLLGTLVYIYVSVKDDVHKIIEQKMDVSSEIFDRNGRKIANIVSNEYRLYVRFSDIPTRVIETLLATEDTTYFEHGGINPEAI